jgi:hypothetical protein
LVAIATLVEKRRIALKVGDHSLCDVRRAAADEQTFRPRVFEIAE